MKVKIDLHTHPLEATRFSPLTVDIAAKIVAQIKAAGLDGIGCTEHFDKDYGFRLRDLVAEYFNNEVLIIPGWEISAGREDVVELFLPNNAVFRILAHPGYRTGNHIQIPDNIQGIEIDNAIHNYHIDKQRVVEIAEEQGLLLFRNSDAHDLSNIGRFYNEIDLEELYARAMPLAASS